MPGAGRPLHRYELIGAVTGAAGGALFAWVWHADYVFAVLGVMLGWLVGGICTWRKERIICGTGKIYAEVPRPNTND